MLSIHNLKTAFCAFIQGNLSNADYLQRYRNLTDIATSLGGILHDEAVSSIVTQSLHSLTDPHDSMLSADKNQSIQDASMEMYLAMGLVQKAYPKRFGKIQDDLENDFTKGTDNYPVIMSKSYQLLTDFKSTHSRSETITTSSQGVCFIHKGGKGKPFQKIECYVCGKKGRLVVV